MVPLMVLFHVMIWEMGLVSRHGTQYSFSWVLLDTVQDHILYLKQSMRPKPVKDKGRFHTRYHCGFCDINRASWEIYSMGQTMRKRVACHLSHVFGMWRVKRKMLKLLQAAKRMNDIPFRLAVNITCRDLILMSTCASVSGFLMETLT